MRLPPANPHAIIEISRPGFSDGQSLMRYDSWEQKRLFENVDIELVTNESSQAEWQLFDPNFKVIDTCAGVSPGPMATVRVFLGFGQDLGEPVFKGLLGQVGRTETSTTFTAFDMAYKMKLEKKAGYKNKKDDLGIIRGLVERNGLQFEGPVTPLKLEPHRAAMQDELTDWEWMMERARDAGLVIFVRHDTVFAKYPAKVGTPSITLRNKKDFFLKAGWDFTYRTPESQDGRPKVVKHRARGKGGKRIEGESETSDRGRVGVVLKKDAPGKATKSKLSKRAQAQKELEREHAFQGRISTILPIYGGKIDVRKTVEVEGIGKLFSGKYICDRVAYRFAAGELGLEIDLYRDIKE
jgi:hypothetical protein